jgi:PAS domain S-box-containing protein
VLDSINDCALQHAPRLGPVGGRIDDVLPGARGRGTPAVLLEVATTRRTHDFGELQGTVGASAADWFRARAFALGEDVVATTFENVTEKRLLEHAHEVQGQMLDAVEQGVIVVDLSGRITFMNAFAGKMYGFRAEEVIGELILERAPAAMHTMIQQTLAHVAKGRTWSGVFTAVRSNGTEFPARAICSPIRQGGIVTGAIAVSIDESERVRSAERARIAEQQRSALISAIPDLIFRVRSDGLFLDFAGATSWLYVPPDQFLGRRIGDVLPPSVAAVCMETVRKALASRGVETCEYQMTIEGAMRTCVARVVADGENEVVIVVRDSTEEFHHQQLLRESYEELEKRVEERTADLERATNILLEQIVERKKAEVALQQSHDRLQLIVNSSPAAMVEIDAAGIILSWNAAAERLFGWRAEEIIGKPDPTVEAETADDLRGLVSAVKRGALFYELPVMRVTKTGVRLPVNLSASPLRDEGGEVTSVLMTATAVSSLRHGDAEIDILRQKLASLSTVTAAVSSSLDVGKILSTFRAEAQRTLRADSGGIFLRALDDTLVFHSGWGNEPEKLESVPMSMASPVDASIRVVTSEGEPRTPNWRCVAAIPVASRQRHCGFLVVGDRHAETFEREQLEFLRTIAREVAIALENAHLFAEVRSANDRLRLLSRSLVAVQEAERRHLGRELHDQIGQTLTGLKFLLESSRGAGPAAAEERLGRAQELVQRLFEEVRTLSLELRPPMLDDAGLLPALVSLIDRFKSQTSLEVTFQHGSIHRFEGETEVAAFRIVQEALTNAARHSRARRVTVRLWTADSALLVQIDDDGVGFDVDASAEKGAGLSSMRERASLVGGRLVIESSPSGTSINVELPMRVEVGSDVVRRYR